MAAGGPQAVFVGNGENFEPKMDPNNFGSK
jgi:hypothetical protein